jgi:Baseplate J-like protein
MEQLSNEVERFLQSLNDADREEATSQEEPEEIIDVYFIPRMEPEEPEEPEEDVVEAIPAQSPQRTSTLFTLATVFFCVGLLLSSILFQLYLAFNPPIAVVTLVTDARTITLTGTVTLGRLTHAITLYQSQTVPTTGRGHQDARAATGTITFYNALFSSQTIPAGSVFVGADGIQVQTDATVSVPANNPPRDGIIGVAAHAVTPGRQGNIQALDINSATSSSLFVKNLDAFTDGRDERTFTIVTKRDIDTTAVPMKPILAHSMRGALEGELKTNEELLVLPCLPAVESNHQPGDEAAKVTITVSQTCDGIAYSGQELQTKATELLTHLAMTKLGAGYTLVGNVQVIVHRAIIIGMTPNLMFSSQGKWIYGLSGIAQEHLKRLIAGKTAQEAEHILSALPGIKNVAMQWDETTKLPKDPQHIKFLVLVEV